MASLFLLIGRIITDRTGPHSVLSPVFIKDSRNCVLYDCSAAQFEFITLLHKAACPSSRAYLIELQHTRPESRV